MDDEDKKILNSRFTLLHSAIEELAKFRRNEYDGLLLRIERLESKIQETFLSAQFNGAIWGASAGLLASMMFLAFLYLSGDK
ncbi:hypothetical protein [Oscillatoria sp. HE19RPO]|uniref:hypothetical protein n=1 Tax=Oscillatoria sp. HE19RPO TaxID=2954806 RepID=UPI0020C45ABB|nr:hypothetical protein [Oscillatoria sp. HE19RPO]